MWTSGKIELRPTGIILITTPTIYSTLSPKKGSKPYHAGGREEIIVRSFIKTIFTVIYSNNGMMYSPQAVLQIIFIFKKITRFLKYFANERNRRQNRVVTGEGCCCRIDYIFAGT